MDTTPKQLIAYRKRHRLTQAQMAEKLGSSKGTIANFECGRTTAMQHNVMNLLNDIIAADTHQEPPKDRRNPEDTPANPSPGFRQQLGLELRQLAAFIEDDQRPRQLQATKFTSTITYYHDTIATHENAILKN